MAPPAVVEPKVVEDGQTDLLASGEVQTVEALGFEPAAASVHHGVAVAAQTQSGAGRKIGKKIGRKRRKIGRFSVESHFPSTFDVAAKIGIKIGKE